MSLNDVLLDELRDLYSAENQLVKSLPKTAKQISDKKLKQTMTEHLEQTRAQVLRLREVFEHLGKKPTGKHCEGMEGCIKEIKEALEEDEKGALKDAGIIGAALRTEHYGIAGYTAALAMAKVLKETEIVKLLNETLHEKQAIAKTITADATAILKAAAAQEDDEGDEDEDEPEDPEEKESEQESEQDEREAEPEMKKAPAKSKKKSAK